MNESLQDDECLATQTQGCCEGGRRPAWPDRNKLTKEGVAHYYPNDPGPEDWEIEVSINDEVAEVIQEREAVAVYSTGAKRSTDADSTRYDLIPPIALRRVAETYAEGAKKYGDNNWVKGFPTSVVLNHLQKHIEQWKVGDDTEDHLAHAVFGLFCLMYYEEASPEMIDRPFVIKVSA